MKNIRFGNWGTLLTLLLSLSGGGLSAEERLVSVYDESDGTGYLLVSGNYETIVFSAALLKLLWLAKPSGPPSLVPVWDYFVLLDSEEILDGSTVPAHLTDFSDSDLGVAVSELKIESARCSVQTTSTQLGNTVYVALMNSSQYGDSVAQVCIADALAGMLKNDGSFGKSDTLAIALSKLFALLAQE